jgi:membrane protein
MRCSDTLTSRKPTIAARLHRSAVFALSAHLLRRARQERLPQAAGSLTFTTLLSVVPLLAVSLSVLARWPLFDRFEAALHELLFKSLLPPEIARTVLAHLHRFATSAGVLPWFGFAFLLVTALAMLLTVENTLNQIWGVKRGRPLLRRAGLYLLALVLGPPVLGASLWATSAVVGASLGWIGPLPPQARFVLQLGPRLLGWVALTGLYLLVPNTRVRRRDALAGALAASIALELGKHGFAAWLLKLPTYKAVYGAFAVFPVFLLWVYFSWLVTLAAALLAAGLGRGAPGRR